MRSRPHFEGTPWLAAHGFGHVLKGPIPPWRFPMSDDVRFAFIKKIDAATKPLICASLDHLADHIEGLRFGQGLQLQDVEDLRFRWRSANGRPEPEIPDGRQDRGVQVFTTMSDGTIDRSLGYAWLDGRDMQALMPALDRARRRRAERKAQPVGQAA